MLRPGVTDFKMQVRRHAAAGITAPGNLLAFAYRELLFIQDYIHIPALLFVLLLTQVLLYFRCEIIEVCVQRGVTVGMVDIQCMSEAAGRGFDTADVACCCGKYRQVFTSLGFNIQSGVKMPRAAFAKIARQENRDIERIAEIPLGIRSGVFGLIGGQVYGSICFGFNRGGGAALAAGG